MNQEEDGRRACVCVCVHMCACGCVADDNWLTKECLLLCHCFGPQFTNAVHQPRHKARGILRRPNSIDRSN